MTRTVQAIDLEAGMVIRTRTGRVGRVVGLYVSPSGRWVEADVEIAYPCENKNKVMTSIVRPLFEGREEVQVIA